MRYTPAETAANSGLPNPEEGLLAESIARALADGSFGEELKTMDDKELSALDLALRAELTDSEDVFVGDPEEEELSDEQTDTYQRMSMISALRNEVRAEMPNARRRGVEKAQKLRREADTVLLYED